jgi:hypothetical protein
MNKGKKLRIVLMPTYYFCNFLHTSPEVQGFTKPSDRWEETQLGPV